MAADAVAADAVAAVIVVKPPPLFFFFGGIMWWVLYGVGKMTHKNVCRGLFLRVVCCRNMPFLEKLADIAMLGRHVGDIPS